MQIKVSAEDYVNDVLRKSGESQLMKAAESTEKKQDEKKDPPVVGLVMPIEEVMKVDQVADDINGEVSELAFGLEPGYDWDIVNNLVQAQKLMNGYLDTVLAKTANDSNARIAFRKLRSRIYMGLQTLQRTLVKNSSSGDEEAQKMMAEQKTEIEKLKKATNSISDQEVLMMDALAD